MIISKISPIVLPILTSFVLIAIAELGDKTQLLALAFAVRYKASTVLGSVFAAIALLNLLAVVMGKFVSLYLPVSAVKIGAGMLFVIFGVWTIVFDDGKQTDTSGNTNPFWTIFGAFFLAELGDKTQLAVMTLAAQYNKPLQIWIGATLGMGIANVLGIFIGNRLGTALPEKTIKIIAGSVFIAFGLFMLGEVIL